MARSKFSRSFTAGTTVAGLALVVVFSTSLSAAADTTINGPIDLGSAADFGVLAASEVTNTGPTGVDGDVGLSPGTSITGFDGAPDGEINGTRHQTDTVAAQAQIDLTTAYNVAASLTPQESGLEELNGLVLTPGVYSGGALILSDTGTLTLAGTAESVWVFQAASSLTIGVGTEVVVTGGASACNVFWQVGSSATLNSGSAFQGTILAQESVTVNDATTVVGRLLARTAAVTLINDQITVPTGCPASGTVTTSPTITSSAPTDATVGTPYDYTVTASGTPTPSFSITSGALPLGLSMDSTTGGITGTPTTPGASTFLITVSNGGSPDASAEYTIATAAARPQLANTGSGSSPAFATAAVAVLLGGALVVLAPRRSRRRH
ncbi:hypothetical protein IWX81_001395 [Salinibacterium sp. CAN_S4]|uniref:ice-binding family protein n=1 Tax=Salinibacterium sp. CAN_S4 TaxID=2787727 RepID=UPI0018F0030B